MWLERSNNPPAWPLEEPPQWLLHVPGFSPEDWLAEASSSSGTTVGTDSGFWTDSSSSLASSDPGSEVLCGECNPLGFCFSSLIKRTTNKNAEEL